MKKNRILQELKKIRENLDKALADAEEIEESSEAIRHCISAMNSSADDLRYILDQEFYSRPEALEKDEHQKILNEAGKCTKS